MKPTKDNVFVTEVEKESTTASGIILTGDVESGLKPAVIVAVGPEASCEVGQKCYLPWGEAKAVTHDGVQGAIISEEEILAFI